MVVIGLLLRDTNEGVEFRAADQIGLIGIGLVLGGVIMTAARPRLRVDRRGLWIRNMLGEQFTPWPLVVRVAYPQGAPWAQVLMPDDEIKPLMAIQAMDRRPGGHRPGEGARTAGHLRPAAADPAAPPPELRPSRVSWPNRSARWAGWRSSTGRRPPRGTAICGPSGRSRRARPPARSGPPQ